MLSVTKRFEFEAAHHLPDYDGVCSNVHGHSYKLYVTVGSKELNKGMVIDFKMLKHIVKEFIVDVYDHQNLNDFFENPTAENMVKRIAEILTGAIPLELRLLNVKLYETEDSYAEWRKGGFV